MKLGPIDISIGFAPGKAIAAQDVSRLPGNAQTPQAPQNSDPYPFKPSDPLPAFAPPAPDFQGWEVPIGYNLDISPDKRTGARHDQLRSLADSCPSMRLVIEALKKEIYGLEWEIAPRVKEEGAEYESDADVKEITAILAKPDGFNVFSDWANAVLEDVIVPGATALGRLRTVGGKHVGLRLVDAAKIVPIVTAAGIPPAPPAAAYYWYAYGVPYKEYTTDELIYRPFNRRSWTPYGYGPVEQTLLLMTLSTNSLLYRNKAFTEGNLPPYLLTMPSNWTEATIREFQRFLDKRMSGNLDTRSKAVAAPDGTGAVKLDAPYENFQYEFEEFLLRCFSWVLGVNPQPILKQMGMGGSHSGFQSNSFSQGVKPFALFIKETLDPWIANDLGKPNLEFNWLIPTEQNQQLELQKQEAMCKAGAMSINEWRRANQLPPSQLPEAELLMVLTATGYTPLEGMGDPPEPVPAALAPFTGGEQPPPGEQKQPEEPPKDGDPPPVPPKKQADEVKAWKRAAKNDIRKGKPPRPFYRP